MPTPRQTLVLSGSVALISALAVLQAWAANDRVAFPGSYAEGVHYATVNRGGIREELYTSRDAIDAAKAGLPMPEGTVIMMEDHRDGGLHRYVVMEKRSGWGAAYPAGEAAGDWEFREFAPDRSPNMAEGGQRCMACHQGQASNDFVFSYDEMRRAD